MNYRDIRRIAHNGAVVGVMGSGFFSKVIKFFTKEQFTHVATFVWHGTGLWIYEFVEGRGYQCMPASQWFEIRAGQKLYYGKAPLVVRANPEIVLQEVSDFRTGNFKRHYGMISLVKVWLSQVLNKKISTRFLVCSTFVQHVWAGCGFNHTKTADPGDIMKISESYAPLIEIITRQPK
jgi:hypothetical protein